MKSVKCKSGIKGWQDKLQKVYKDFVEWESYAYTFGLHTRLGYKTPHDAWKENPTIRGSVKPEDFCKVLSKNSSIVYK